MINMRKTYAENISQEDNKCYAKIVDDLISTGKISDKYSMLLDTDGVVNVIVLSLLKITQELKTDGEEFHKHLKCKANTLCGHETYRWYNTSRKTKYSDLSTAPFVKKVGIVGEMFKTLPKEIKEKILFGVGIDMIVNLALDETKGFMEPLVEISNRYNGAPPVVKPTHKNISNV